MLVYPQLGTGGLSQFPVRKQRRKRTVVNTAADGRSIKLADPNGEVTEWRLAYTELSDTETGALQDFFAAAEGSLNGFTFVDPAANLLAWSGKLDETVWAAGPLVSITGGIEDPAGGTLASRLSNGGAGPQGITQTLEAPSRYVYCLSAYVRGPQAAMATMLIGSASADRPVASQWTRIQFTASGDAAAASISFGLTIPAAASVDVYGLQVEAQSAASSYKGTTTGGVYENARLADDVLAITTTGVNRHSCTLNIIHAKHF
jgi:hypothetical protein